MSTPHISSLSISYAGMASVECPVLSPSVNVIFGHNEAGKTRIQEFLKWMMFAPSEEIEELKTAATKKAFAGLDPSISGSVVFNTGDISAKLTQRLVDGITQSNIDTNRISPKELSRIFTDGLLRAHYNNIFSLTLDELAQVESDKFITETEMMNLFFGATSTGAGISPTALLQALATEKENLFAQSKNATTKSINKTLKLIKENAAHIKELRLEEKGFESIDSDIDTMRAELEKIDQQITKMQRHRELSARIIENSDDYGIYERLSNVEKPEINNDLVSHSVEINMLVQMSEQGDEEELERIESILAKMKSEHEKQKVELALTLDPDTIETPIYTPHLSSVLSEEERAQNEHSLELKRLANSINEHNNDLGLFMQEAERLRIQLETTPEVPQESEPLAPTSRTRPIAPIIAAGSCAVVGIFCFLFGQTVAGIFGLVAALTIGIYAANHLTTPSTLNTVKPLPIINTQAERDFESLVAKIENYQSRIESLLTQQSDTITTRENNQKQYINEITQCGFSSDAPPHLVSLYLDAYRTYADRKERIAELEANYRTAQSRISEPLLRAEKLRPLAIGTTCETDEKFVRLSDVHTWASALYDLSEVHKSRDEQLHQQENEMRQIEKTLTARFGSIEKAREIYERISINDVANNLEQSREELETLYTQRKEIDTDIVRKTVERERAGTSTAIAQAIQQEQSLIDEIKSLHQQYASVFLAHSVVTQALEKYLDENQPELLRVASHMLDHVTSGEWNSITITQNETSKKNEPLIRVSGTRAPHGISITQLSRGTREQLYLCLRLALMRTSTRGHNIPVLFDDIAVNSDRSRIETLADIIGEIGQSRQVIYFTCHETTRDILAKRSGAQIITI